MSYDSEKQLSPSPSPRGSKVIGCLSFLPILLGRNTSRFTRLLRHNVIGKILLILGSGYILTIATLYLFSSDVYPSTESLKSLWEGYTSNNIEEGIADDVFNPRKAVDVLRQTGDGEIPVFKWNDWLDLSDVEEFDIEGYDQSKFKWLSDSKKTFKDFKFPPRKRLDEKEHAFIGKLYLDRVARVPNQVILVGEARATYAVKGEVESKNHMDYAYQPDVILTPEEKAEEDEENRKKEEKKKKEEEKKKKEEEEKKKKDEEEKKKKDEEKKKKEEEEKKKKDEEKKKKEDEEKKKKEDEDKKKKEEEEKKNKEEEEKKKIEEDKKQEESEENLTQQGTTTSDATSINPNPPSPPSNVKRELLQQSPDDSTNIDNIPIVSQVIPAEPSSPPAPTITKTNNYGLTPNQIFPPAVPILATGTPEDKVAVELPANLFTLDLARLQKTNENSTALEVKHAAMIKRARKYITNAGKHFHEVPLTNDPNGHGTHYDWRFFNLVRHGTEHEAVMHHLMRAWSMFSNQEGIASWISHGSLIGWYWNGFAMPWDADNDVQMPIVEFDRFAQLYNGTLVVEDEKEGTGRYYIDVGPFYVSRVKGNGFNVIDARFIDIRSGIYIDITGLAQTDRPNQFACKNNHYYFHDWLSPMRKTLYEGVEVYVPNMYEAVLKDEYKKYRQSSFKDWSFNRDLRLWVPTKKCAKFNVPSLKYDENDELNLYGACNDANIFKEYTLTKDISLEHAAEMDIYNQMDIMEKNGKTQFVDTPETRRLFAKEFSNYYPPLRVDPGFSRIN